MPRHVRKIPIHYLETRHKLSVLDRLTARLTYAVRLFCEAGEAWEMTRSRRDIRQFSGYVAEKTGLSTGLVQQAEDMAFLRGTA